MSQAEASPLCDDVWRSDIDYELPHELIAQAPAAERDGSRLLVLDRRSGSLEHARFRDLIAQLRPGDCLVANDSRVYAARLFASKSSGGRVELLVLDPSGAGDRVPVMLRTSKPLRRGQQLALADGSAIRVASEPHAGRAEIDFGSLGVAAVLARLGHTPLPPYIERAGVDLSSPGDEARYQTVYARHTGSVAAPTAGLHFTVELIARLRERDIGFETITLHVGPGTFTPVRGSVAEHRMEAESCSVSAATVDRLRACRGRGGRVVAVGTTVVRTLETAAAGGTLQSYNGPTDLFIRPGHEFRAVDALITNFHLPGSTLLCLTLALGGETLVRRAYSEAVAQRYRFYSYGDAMLVT